MGMDKYIKTFLISLEENTDLRKPFHKHIKNFTYIKGVDTRKNGFAFRDFGLMLDPPNKIVKIEFSKNKGAIGCYLSHYSAWKQMVADKVEYGLILEEDARAYDAKKVLNTDTIRKHLDTSEPTLLQLNKRTTHKELPWWFDGTESYAINLQGANALIENTYDMSDLQSQFIEYAWSWDELERGCYGLFKKYEKYDMSQNYTAKNTIRFPVDKFIGYCSLPCIDDKKRLKIKIENKIGLISNIESNIKCGKQVWTMSESEIEMSEKDTDYMWWDKNES